MTPTLQLFTRALLTPDLSFGTLAEARAATGADRLPRLMRTTRFVEAEIAWNDRQWLLSMPLSPAALASVERTASQLGRLNTDRLAEYRILRDELRCTDPEGRQHRFDLVLQLLPAGKPFAEALHTQPAERLLAALDDLETALRELNFSHNNLRAENLRWSGGGFVPLRYHDAHFGPSGDGAAFEVLREQVRRTADPMCVGDTEAVYAPHRRPTGHRWTSHVFEGLVCVEDDEGFGFVDTENNPVIRAQYIWAGDFREGRAEIEPPTGMGLIDRQGHYVIPPQYEIVDYVPAESIVRVRKDGR
ncbi:WG repeat-containing protein [Alistipes sp.]|uniref:WG repeat-containing protein n=1 Tax=Alistipes sp. TaxID=1872444 RepID=UPI0025C3E41B|nr:WG repeat-containing protein [Alistipes sp.]